MAAATSHPSAADLTAYGQGRLDAARSEAVARHLEQCAACRQTVEETPMDTLATTLSAGKPADATQQPSPAAATRTPTPAVDTRSDMPTDGPVTSSHVPKPPPTSATQAPPGLANHPQYRLLRLLGKGGMGAVYLAEHTVMARKVALKVVQTSVLGNPQAVERFRKEIVSAARLDHNNIVRALHAEQSEDSHFLVMEYVEGIDLHRYLEKKGPLPIAHACNFVRQAALGLQHAHEQGMVHRDIKPQNLMLTTKGVVKVLDFGLAKVASESGCDSAGGGTEPGRVMGTPDFMAPEQADDARSADIRADIYSLGCTLYALLGGMPPFGDAPSLMQKLMAHQVVPPKPLHEIRPEVPLELSQLCQRMLAKKPADRPQSPAEVARALTPYLRASAKPAVSPPPISVTTEAPPFEGPAPPVVAVPRRPALPRRSPLLFVLAAVVLLLGVTLAAALVLRVRTSAGVVLLEIDPPDAEVIVDGETVSVARAGTNPVEIRGKPGKKILEIRKGGFRAETREITLLDGQRESLRIRLEPMGPDSPETPMTPADAPEEETPSPDSSGRVAFIVVGAKAHLQIEQSKSKLLTIDRNDRPEELRVFGPVPVNSPVRQSRRYPVSRFRIDKAWFGLGTGFLWGPYRWPIGTRFEILALDSEFTGQLPRRPRGPFYVYKVKVLAPGAAPTPTPAETGFVPLFNDRDFTGWEYANPTWIVWKNDNGLITGVNNGNRAGAGGSIFTQKEYSDFHFRCEVRAGTPRLTMLYFRHNRSTMSGNRRGLGVLLPGPESAEVDKGWGIGSLFEDIFQVGFNRVAPSAVPDLGINDGEWYELDIIARGRKIQVFVNDEQTVDHELPDDRYLRGSFGVACQIGSRVAIRKVQVKEFPPGND